MARGDAPGSRSAVDVLLGLRDLAVLLEPWDGITAVVNARRAMGLIGALILAAAVVAGCGAGKHRADTVRLPQLAAPTRSTAASLTRRPAVSVYYRVPPLLNPHNVYAADRKLAPVARHFRPLVYVPDTAATTSMRSIRGPIGSCGISTSARSRSTSSPRMT